MKDRMAIGLPNGKVCYLTSKSMRTAAKFLRWEIFKQRQYEYPGFELRSNDTLVDIGGNIGMFALWAAPQIPAGRLVSVEPNPAALECLRLNVERNNLRNVTIVPAAAGGEDGTMDFVYHPGWEMLGYNAALDAPWFATGSRMARFFRWLLQRALNHAHDFAADQKITVRQMTLPRIMDEYQVGAIDYLKIDCEGGEFEILRGMNAAYWSRIERIVVEYHDYGSDRKHGELVRILQNNDFHVVVARSWFECVFAPFGAHVGMIWAKRRSSGRI